MQEAKFLMSPVEAVYKTVEFQDLIQLPFSRNEVSALFSQDIMPSAGAMLPFSESFSKQSL